MKIQDFGEKIGGAKKDVWRSRGLQLDDIMEMNGQEKSKYIKKDNVWKKPDYQKMVDEGLPLRVAYFIKSVRDALPTKPNIPSYVTDETFIQNEQEKFVSFISEMRDALLNLKTENDVLSFHQDFIIENYIIQDGYRLSVTDKARNLYSNKINQKTNIKNFFYIDREIQRKQFCYSKEDKMLADYSIKQFDKNVMSFEKDYNDRTMLTEKTYTGKTFYYPENEFANEENWNDKTYFVMKKREVLAINFDTFENAKAFALEREQGKEITQQRKQRKKAFVPPQFQFIIREGDDYRHGRNMTGNDYLDVFGFKGGEFGNWLNEYDRQQSLNYGYDALIDMSKALGIDPKDISLSGTLSIAFGARGEGNALAHYEPLRQVINLTKMKGAGSLAHEWGHALDDYIGKALGYLGTETMASGRSYDRNNLVSMKNILKDMCYKLDDSPEIVLKQTKDYEDGIKTLNRRLNGYLKFVPDEYNDKKEELKAEFINSKNPTEREDALEKLSRFKKELTKHGLTATDKDILTAYFNQVNALKEIIGKPEKVKTDFYVNSIKFDEISSKTGHGYWQSNEEMFARAFACYIYDKVGVRSDYLCGHANSIKTQYVDRNGNTEVIKAYPTGEERERINRGFDELIKELKEKELLHEYEVPEIREEKNDEQKDVIEENNADKITLASDEIGQFSFDFDLDEMER